MAPNPWGDRRLRRVGLLGGSFNPAHEGHRHISVQALHGLGVDEIWWLVSPQNPLKPTLGMAPQEARVVIAEAVARHPRIRVTGLETRLGTRYTADTLRILARRFPSTRFVWLMGADNLAQMPRWDRWQRIFRTVAVAVFDRSPYSYKAMAGKAARRFARYRSPLWRGLAEKAPPAWVFVHMRLHPASATAIRQRYH